jgi:hypothetical protein
MSDLTLIEQEFNNNGYWTIPLIETECPGPECVDLFDQNGYDLSALEIRYSLVNHGWHSEHRNYNHIALKRPWVSQPIKTSGAVVNHALIFERKGYAGAALEQLENWATENNLIYKVARYRPKWGFDFSIDFASSDGVFEIWHYEYDGFDPLEVSETKKMVEQVIMSTDWDDAAKSLLARKDEWYHLDFFEQSNWKCRFFGMGPERFKMVAWE